MQLFKKNVGHASFDLQISMIFRRIQFWIACGQPHTTLPSLVYVVWGCPQANFGLPFGLFIFLFILLLSNEFLMFKTH
jgi:hypothetical protein